MNRLASEPSPYLRQHADNPVDWYPWGPEAFARARTEQKPLFLSIGYSTCHWCHVMAHESFEDPATAELLNADFVPVKLDREERPDVDRIYMGYVQALTGHGGWPLNVWLTPELKPFFGGTYFPPDERLGRAGFPAVLRAVARAWRDDRPRLVAEADRVVAALSEVPRGEAGSESLPEAAERAYGGCFAYFRRSFDSRRGGFGDAPKFPRASALSFLFGFAARPGTDPDRRREAVRMAAVTLQGMARGGIHDQVGGGFHRYSVDADWFVPHFEKMLYDQAQIASNAVDAWRATGDERHAWLARDILDYARRDLSHPEGGFFSAEDADSEPPVPGGSPSEALAKEGVFYLWTKGEIEAVLGAGEAGLVCEHFGIRDGGNVPASRDPHGEFRGRNILAQAGPLPESARKLGISPQEANDRLMASLLKLRQTRDRRPRPLRDEKIIAGWNGMMISALACASSASAESLEEPREEHRAAAVRAASFIERELFDPERGRLYRCWLDGRRGAAEGFAEDYAYVIRGLLDLYEATFELRWLKRAEQLQQKMDELFWDAADGGYFNSAAGAPDLVARLKDDYDGAEPAASSVAVSNLTRLGSIFPSAPGAMSPRDRAARTLESLRSRWLEAPYALPELVGALEPALAAPRSLAIAGSPGSPDFLALASVAREGPGPRRVLVALDGGRNQAWFASRAPWLEAMRPIGGRATAYVCEGFTCRAPVTTPEELRALLYPNS